MYCVLPGLENQLEVVNCCWWGEWRSAGEREVVQQGSTKASSYVHTVLLNHKNEKRADEGRPNKYPPNGRRLPSFGRSSGTLAT